MEAKEAAEVIRQQYAVEVLNQYASALIAALWKVRTGDLWIKLDKELRAEIDDLLHPNAGALVSTTTAVAHLKAERDALQSEVIQLVDKNEAFLSSVDDAVGTDQ